MTSFWKEQRVVVTGGAGFLGSFVVEQLRAKGCHQIVIPRSQDYDLVQMVPLPSVHNDQPR
jgi:GDP-L-fucose synthase